ncbi:MAG: hypothetical protein A2741_00120 [Candidatus Zambryskibacteria bacterium RIFCSPHIGHO2_01_FULL_43_27]|uniref:Uncharacterized protein n=1 Tax=Candidatus Zambryskibacteria bacterium RIFCSPLOWO2_01_FULL_43_17 TaxID=1802760 RepID=A0A1G2U5M2_9BACT|nr:MAG: hypothetical protein A2741_00120 [Candidatus Zambryskibacteria bacterium RIFCSPHIGHO2_01_FULL_43_27]OHA99491.1 MAG: hypothetical protein A3E93_02845 [Candidatus Zambryskibacteria bacterium RIFCSPHIGHO2_12_FULL_43_12b]OHB04767.1 MAG: hypothetical protein A2920_00670 [Candidatus Zambryskibacteria bacterium RIFCSPLOWO2_01_FULL_43_17]
MRFFVAAMLSLCISDSAVSQISIRPNALSQTICDKQTGEPVVLIRRDSIGKSVTRFLIEHEFKHVSDALSHKGGCLGWESERDVSPAFKFELPAACANISFAVSVRGESYDSALKSAWLAPNHGNSVYDQASDIATKPWLLQLVRDTCTKDFVTNLAEAKEDSVRRKYRMRCVKDEMFCVMSPIQRAPTRK